MKRPSMTGFLACDAIEAAFLHDGPDVKAHQTLVHFSSRTAQPLQQLRACLYSLQATRHTSPGPCQ